MWLVDIEGHLFKLVFLLMFSICTGGPVFNNENAERNASDNKNDGRFSSGTDPVISELSRNTQPVNERVNELPECIYTLKNESKDYFDSRLESLQPHFIQFSLDFDKKIYINETAAAFMPRRWVWTYSSSTDAHPYLSWNIDYGILSFGLLDAESIEIRYVHLHTKEHPCIVTLGSFNTTWNIVETLTGLVNMSHNSYHKYENNYFCYLAEAPGLRDSITYQFAIYWNFPITFINYDCCLVSFHYTNGSYVQSCSEPQMVKWTQCVIVPYILGVIIFLYFPILLFEICAYLAIDEHIIQNEYALVGNVDEDRPTDEDDSNWIFLTGKPPINIFDAFSFKACCIHARFPVLVSRLRRLFSLLVAPVIIFIKLYMYKDGMGIGNHRITVPDLVKNGTPMGFLGLLADSKDSIKVFAPIFGGPMCLLMMYYVLGIVLIVLPNSVKQIVENGLSASRCRSDPTVANTDDDNSYSRSPFCFSVGQITRMAMVDTPLEPGYKKAAAVYRCSFYMLFSSLFWKEVFAIQKRRFFMFNTGSRCLKVVVFPTMAVFGLAETVFCVLYYSIPFFGFVVTMIKGAAMALWGTRLRQNHWSNVLFRNPASVMIGTLIILAMFLYFAYSVCLIFIESFTFIAQIIMFCFVAVIVYPSVSFGYLFFFVVILYYFVRLIRDFGDGYLELLSSAVETSMNIDRHVNYVTVYDGHLILSNVRTNNIRDITINNGLLDVREHSLNAIETTTEKMKTKKKDNTYGIPKDLFNFLVRKYRPVHIHILKLVFQLGLIIILITMTMDITSKLTSGPTSETSDVMHVIFLVTVGALPRVLEVAMINESEVVKKEIQDRNIEQSIVKYWHRKGDTDIVLEY